MNKLAKQIIKQLQSYGYRLLEEDEEYTNQTKILQIMGVNLIYTAKCTIEVNKDQITVNEQPVEGIEEMMEMILGIEQ